MLVEAVDAVFGYGRQPVVAASAVVLRRGRCVGIFGPNGSGKTTLAHGLCGLLTPMAGMVRRREHLSIGYVPQHRGLHLHWPMSGLDAAAMAGSARRRFGWVGRRQSARAMMRRLGVEELADEPLARLSGGQQQRLLLAGAMADGPDLLVLDEPTEGLDLRWRQATLATLRQLREEGLGLLVISHSVEDLLALCDEALWLRGPRSGDGPNQVDRIEPDLLGQRVESARAGARARGGGRHEMH